MYNWGARCSPPFSKFHQSSASQHDTHQSSKHTDTKTHTQRSSASSESDFQVISTMKDIVHIALFGGVPDRERGGWVRPKKTKQKRRDSASGSAMGKERRNFPTQDLGGGAGFMLSPQESSRRRHPDASAAGGPPPGFSIQSSHNPRDSRPLSPGHPSRQHPAFDHATRASGNPFADPNAQSETRRPKRSV